MENIMVRTFSSQRDSVIAALDYSERIEWFYHDELPHHDLSGKKCWEVLEDRRECVHENGGQFISLDFTDPMTECLLETLYNALQNERWEQSMQFSLPVILQHNPHIVSPFINRAILWQRICDLLIMDDSPDRETVLVLEYADQASPAAQHEIARLIRFHETHSIRRTFVLTLSRDSRDQVIPELRNILGI